VRFGTFLFARSKDEIKCRHCKQEIFAKNFYFGLVGFNQKKESRFTIRIHPECFKEYIEASYLFRRNKIAEDLRVQGRTLGGRPALQITAENRWERKKMMSYLSYDRKQLLISYKLNRPEMRVAAIRRIIMRLEYMISQEELGGLKVFRIIGASDTLGYYLGKENGKVINALKLAGGEPAKLIEPLQMWAMDTEQRMNTGQEG